MKLAHVTSDTKCLFRVVDCQDLWGGFWYPEVKRLKVLSETEKTWLVESGSWRPPRRVLKVSRKRFACQTESDAWVSYRARKLKQVRILTEQLERSKALLEVANRAVKEGETK